MTEQQRQALIRDALHRRLAARGLLPSSVHGTESSDTAPAVNVQQHISHHVYVTLVNDSDACVIEPSVPCTHCNYCKSHGY